MNKNWEVIKFKRCESGSDKGPQLKCIALDFRRCEKINMVTVKMKRKRLLAQFIAVVVVTWGVITLKQLNDRNNAIERQMAFIYQEVPLQINGESYEYYTDEELKPIRKREKQRPTEPGAYGHPFPLGAANEEDKAKIAAGWDRQGFNEEVCKRISLHREWDNYAPIILFL